MSETLVQVDQLKVKFPIRGKRKKQYITPVDNVSFKIEKGEVLALVGESGSGKSTIGKSLLRIIEPCDGSIEVLGNDITHIKGKQLVQYRKNAQMIFQDPFGSLNPVKTVENHLKVPLKLHRLLKGENLDDQIAELLLRVELTPVEDVRKKYPHELSGGQRQRLAIARALAVNPKFIVADEPISMLDVSIRAGILKLMNQLKDEMRLSFLFITHDLASARYFGDRIMVLYGGKVMEVAKSSDLVGNPIHPYTKLLLAATPGGASTIDISDVKQEAPDLSEDRKGCPFASRCPFAMEQCIHSMPELKARNVTNHFVACHLD
jgi:peptide/nickel transport system ATP-binding protein